jgi:hypothetical protein
MTRDEHLAWAKKRALEYWRQGDLENAVTSMGSDLEQHPETKPNAYLLVDGVKRWIEGFR